MTINEPLILTTLAKSVLIPPGFTAVASATDTGRNKKSFKPKDSNTNNFKRRWKIYQENNNGESTNCTC